MCASSKRTATILVTTIDSLTRRGDVQRVSVAMYPMTRLSDHVDLFAITRREVKVDPRERLLPQRRRRQDRVAGRRTCDMRSHNKRQQLGKQASPALQS